MSMDSNSFVEWEEHIISNEKGNRRVHYFLKNESGNAVLAIVGTQRSVRHMMYGVAEDYLQAYGSEGLINASMKWRARREVVDWLTAMVSKHRPSFRISNASTSDSMQALGSQELSTAGISALPLQTHLPFHIHMVPRRLKVNGAEIEWSGVYWFCNKQLRHYPAFRRNELTIAVHSFVFIRAEEQSHYIGYLEDLYEDKKGQKKVKVRWFHHNREIKRVFPQLSPHPREIFITPHVQAISAECVDGRATVLTPKHYEKWLAAFSHSQRSRIHVCSRQFKSNTVKPFSLGKLRGYLNQRVLSFLNHPHVLKHGTKGLKANGEEDYDVMIDNHGERGAKRNHVAANSFSRNQITKCEPTYKKLRIKFSSRDVKFDRTQGSSHASFKVGEKIELLCQDSGIRGCWFRCEILQASEKRLKVQYVDLQDADESTNLEEWVPASKLAASDKLGMRCSGRHTIRPWPSDDSSDCSFEVGAPVDAWWSDGYWEGVVIGIDKPQDDNLQVYFPGDDRFLTIKRKYIRASRDWIGNRWVDIKAKPDILSCISSTISPSVKFQKCSLLDEASNCDPSA